MKKGLGFIASLLTVPVLMSSQALAASQQTSSLVRQVILDSYHAHYRQETVQMSEVIHFMGAPVRTVANTEEHMQYANGQFSEFGHAHVSAGSKREAFLTFSQNNKLYVKIGGVWHAEKGTKSDYVASKISTLSSLFGNASMKNVNGDDEFTSTLTPSEVLSVLQTTSAPLNLSSTKSSPLPTNPKLLKAFLVGVHGSEVMTSSNHGGKEVIRNVRETLQLKISTKLLEGLMKGLTSGTKTTSKPPSIPSTMTITVHIDTTDSYKSIPVHTPKGIQK